MSYIDDSVTSTAQWEGTVPWMYLDTKSNVTVGCGLEVPNTGVACSLPFQLQSGGAALEDDVIADFRRVKALAPGKLPGFYHSDASPVLVKAYILVMLRKRIVADDSTLRTAFVGWDSFPCEVKQALLDMEYNLGEAGLLRKYPMMDSAVRRGDWATASLQCFRHGISVERNEWTKNLFVTASQAA